MTSYDLFDVKVQTSAKRQIIFVEIIQSTKKAMK